MEKKVWYKDYWLVIKGALILALFIYCVNVAFWLIAMKSTIAVIGGFVALGILAVAFFKLCTCTCKVIMNKEEVEGNEKSEAVVADAGSDDPNRVSRVQDHPAGGSGNQDQHAGR